MAEMIEANAYINIPQVKIFFLPCMSAMRPKGIRNTAADKRNEVATQLNVTASMGNSLPIDGRAILIEDAIKGVRKAAMDVTINTAAL